MRLMNCASDRHASSRFTSRVGRVGRAGGGTAGATGRADGRGRGTARAVSGSTDGAVMVTAAVGVRRGPAARGAERRGRTPSGTRGAGRGIAHTSHTAATPSRFDASHPAQSQNTSVTSRRACRAGRPFQRVRASAARR